MDTIGMIGNLPEARFGHTICQVSKEKVILFGGAVGDPGKMSFTGDSHTYDLQTKSWRKIETTGNQPVPRAAHAATTVQVNQMVIYGGSTGGGKLASDDLYLLDSRGSEYTGLWVVISVVGQTPGRRYGHSLNYLDQYLILFGGNTGQISDNDCWCIKVDKSPYNWMKIDTNQRNIPQARIYHSASICTTGISSGMLLIFGGRSNQPEALNDTWGLCKHRDGRWDWVSAPNKNNQIQPTGRYQHTSNFFGSLLVIIGGRSNDSKQQLTMDVFDTQTSHWYKLPSIQRFRHCSWIIGSQLFACGGFDSFQVNSPVESVLSVNLKNQLHFLEENSMQQTSQINKQIPYPSSSHNTSIDGSFSTQIDTSIRGQVSNNQINASFTTNHSHSPSQRNIIAQNLLVQNNQIQSFQDTKNMTQLNLTQQNRPISTQFQFLDPIQSDNHKNEQQNKKRAEKPTILHKKFINFLLQPKTFLNLPQDYEFPFTSEEIIQLCDKAEEIIKNQPTLISVKPPLKIFGDIHGQYSDLMRFFDLWGCPSEEKDGDINNFDYLFLGDYVDRGAHSLETICLLLSLKIQYPNQIHLLRGNHEDRQINEGFGFRFECDNRLGEDGDDENSVFARINRLFQWLPLAALIGERILCVHGGIGCGLTSINDILSIKRPLEIVHEVNTIQEQIVVDIIWSDPTDSDEINGIHPNFPRDPLGTGKIVKFGPDRVSEVLRLNNLNMIIRAHECVMDGFERFAGGKLITVFSATDYCGHHKNAGAMLIVKNNYEIIPKLIYPTENTFSNWLRNNDQRPFTPPKWRDQYMRKKSFD